MPVATLKTRRILLDAVIDPCLCNLVLWSESTADGWNLHIGPCCSKCLKLALKAAQASFAHLPPVIFED